MNLELDWNKDSPTSSLSDASYFDKHTRTLSQDTSLTSIDNDYNPLQIITESLVSGKQPKVNPVPVPTDMDKIEATKKPALETNSNRSSLFGRWSLKGNRASLITPLPGFQEELLAQMEQMNTTNLNDPKTKILKRKSIRKTLVTHQKDDHDWGNNRENTKK
jgi:hypothetical protein